MPRVSYYAADEALSWFELDKAEQVADQVTEWDGRNHISRATGSQWVDEELWRTAGGAWVIGRNNRDLRIGPPGMSWHGIEPAAAETWLRKQDMHELADQWFGVVEERGPGRPEIGGRATIAIGDDRLVAVDRARAEVSRAEWIRRAIDAALEAGT